MPADLRLAINASAKAREWLQRRDEAIRDALRRGASLREVAKACALAHNAVVRIRDRG